MPTIKSQLVNCLIRNRHLLQGKLHKETFDDSTSIIAFRDLCEKGAARFAQIPKGMTIQEASINGMKAEWYFPENVPHSKIILYVHGGGYVSGSCSDHRNLVTKFASNCHAAALLYEYRLAPENPFPAAVDDSVKAYHWLLGLGIRPQDIVIVGESAGGGLALALLLALKEQQIALPAAAVAISPWADLTCSGESYRTKNKVSVAPLNSWFVFSKHYVAGADPKNPLISPLFGDLTGLPPILLNAGADDELFDDSKQFYQKAKAAGVDVHFTQGHRMVHCYPFFSPMFREATEAMDEIVLFVKKHLD